MKLVLLFISILATITCYAQEILSVTAGDVKHDAEFSKNFTSLLDASKNGFSVFTKHFVKYDEPDSIWALDKILPGTVGDSMLSDENTATLIRHYHFDDLTGWNDLVQKLKGSLPPDFQYMVVCSDEKGCQYQFTAKAGPNTQPSYDGLVLLNVDAGFKEVTLMINHHR